MIFIYSLLWLVLIVILWFPALIYGLLRGEKLGDRIGVWHNAPQNAIWIHASSMGETAQASALAQELAKMKFPIILTATTLAGYERLRKYELPNCSVYLQPIDFPPILYRLFKHITPRILIVLESDLWFGMLDSARRNSVKVVVASARLSDRSVKWSKILPFYFEPLMRRIDKIFARNSADAKNFALAGAVDKKIEILGDLKLASNNSDLGETGLKRPEGSFIIIWGSVRPSEEKLSVDVIEKIIEQFPNSLNIIAPRHPDRFDEVAKLLREKSLQYTRRSQSENISSNIRVYLLDTMGELSSFYCIADIAVIGGTFADYGGHNPFEATACGVPVIHGIHTQNNFALFKFLDDNNVAFCIENDKIFDKILEFCSDRIYNEQIKKRALDVSKKIGEILPKYISKIVDEIEVSK
ncbi:hypothetical protein J7L68_03240 [bacterium]|nr:hypothetical protein [bacterium]